VRYVFQFVGSSTEDPAVEALWKHAKDGELANSDNFERINTAGSLCVRCVGDTQDRTSSQSYGLALDLNSEGRLDTLGDNKTQQGLTLLGDFPHRELGVGRRFRSARRRAKPPLH